MSERVLGSQNARLLDKCASAWLMLANSCSSYLFTYLLTPRSRVLLEKLTGSAASQGIPPIFGTRRFITVLTSARHLSLTWANSIQSPQSPPTSWRSILILSPICVWVSPLVSFPQVSPLEPCTPLSPAPYGPHAPPISFFSILPTNTHTHTHY